MYISSQAFFQTFSSPFTQVLTVSAVLLLPAALSPAANCSPRRVLLVSIDIYISTYLLTKLQRFITEDVELRNPSHDHVFYHLILDEA